MLKAVFFDFDYTLQDLDGAHVSAAAVVFNPVCQKTRVSLQTIEAQLEIVWPPLWQQFLAGTLGEAELYPRWFHGALALSGAVVSEDTAIALAAHYHDLFESRLRLYPDALPAVRRLLGVRPALQLAILTNGPTERQQRRIQMHGLRQYISHCIISEEAGVFKPDPQFFRQALLRVDAQAPRTVMIGDDPHADISGARAIGIRAVWLNRTDREWPETASLRPDAEARDLLKAVDTVLGWA